MDNRKRKMNREDVSIVICTYNEEKTVANVIKKCRKFNPDSEIIVVDDGSDDASPEILEKLQQKIAFTYIRLVENRGKSNAMVTGVENSTKSIILFFDADVKGIKRKHFAKLLAPLLDENVEVDMVLGSPSDTLINYKVNPFKGLTGERALFKKDIEPLLEDIRNIQFGIETYLNLHYKATGKTIKYQVLVGLEHPTKYEKTSAAEATKEFIFEGQEVATTLLQNTDLITRIIGTNIKEKGDNVKNKLKELQLEMNEKINAMMNNNG